jgi:NTE family protein
LRNAKWVASLVIVALVAGCAHYPINPRLARFDEKGGYRFGNLSSPDNSDKLFVILTFSGGGTRAAALSYGVMAQLRDTTIRVDGKPRRLLDEVDVISSVSGGSFTAAYYALQGDGLFETFEDGFLKRNVQGALMVRMLTPWNLVKLASRWFSRIDAAAEYYDEHVFGHHTFGDLVEAGRRPFIVLNATDMTLGRPFEFTQDQFDLLYSDLSQVPIARGVAASSAFPGAFSPLTLQDHQKMRDFVEPKWVAEGLRDTDPSTRRYQTALQARSYVDDSERPFIHLMDGGVADNLGLRTVVQSLTTTDCPWSVLRMKNLKMVDRVVVIVVNARPDPDTVRDRKASAPSLPDALQAAVSGLMNNVTFESLALLDAGFAEHRQAALVRKACEQLLRKLGITDTSVLGGPLHEVAFSRIEVSFDHIQNPDDRQYFKSLPTSFALPDEAVDRLIRVGGRLLAESEEFHELLNVLAAEPSP